MGSDRTQDELFAALIAQKLIRGGYSIERAIWLSALEVGITLPMSDKNRYLPPDK